MVPRKEPWLLGSFRKYILTSVVTTQNFMVLVATICPNSGSEQTRFWSTADPWNASDIWNAADA